MNKLKSAIVAFLATAALACLTPPPAASAGDGGKYAAAAEAGTALTPKEISAIYENQSWLWDDGAGRFVLAKRAFSGYSGKTELGSYGDGRWFMPGRGRLCFRATWGTVNGDVRKLDCFEHRRNGGVIYQRNIAKGDWYIFKDNPLGMYDEIRKLTPRDAVTVNYRRNKAYIDERRAQKPCSVAGGVQFLCKLFGH